MKSTMVTEKEDAVLKTTSDGGSAWNIDTLKAHVDSMFFEKEKQVTQMFINADKALAAALAAQKELNTTIQISSDKAITKAEEAQKSYNQSHNDLARKMEEQYKNMIPRAESDAKRQALAEKIDVNAEQIARLASRLDLIAGRGQGIDKFIGWIIAAIAVVGFILKNKI